MIKYALGVLCLTLIGCGSSQLTKMTRLGEIQDCDVCPKMVIVPPGSLNLNFKGQTKKITFNKPFAIGIYEVTFQEWTACVKEGACKEIKKNAGWGPWEDDNWERENRPVIRIDWGDTQEYIKWISNKTRHTYRLPSETEWEYAARAGTKTDYYWGNELNGNANCQDCGSQWDGRETSPVGSFSPNSLGLYDMHGNVYEWVQDCVTNDISKIPNDGKPVLDCKALNYRILRGGSWLSTKESITSNHRLGYHWSGATHTRGFRVLREIE